jgi:divalent metal cation (Fe/Co/Zn/Cd) transporter
VATIAVPRSGIEKRIFLLQWLTLGWMLVECSVALTAAFQTRSASLLAFGSDSVVELISAVVVLLQFTSRFRVSQVKAAIAGLIYRLKADISRSGIAITAGALLLMPVLASLKRRAANETGNRALRADAVQSATCAYLAALTLDGLLVRSAFGLNWLDQVAALAAVPILIIEGKRARKGHACC